MKITKLLGAVLLALAAMAFSPGQAAAVNTTYTDGDLFLGLRATGATQDLLINLGQPSSLASGSIPNVASKLSTLFGANWYDRTDLFFSVIGGNSLGGADPVNTIYATRKNATAWPRRSDGSQSSTTTLIAALGNAFSGVDSPDGKALVQNATSNNSYASFQPGGTLENSNGISFSTFSPTNEGTPKTLLYLNRLTPSSAASGATRFGTIALSSTGAVTFTPAAAAGTTKVQFEQPLASVGEAGGHATLTVVRDGDTTSAFTVNVSTANGTAASTDYTALTNSPVSFAAGQTSAPVNVNVNDVAGFQGDRTFTATLSGPTAGVTLGSPATTTVTIVEDDAASAGVINFTQTAVSSGQIDGNGNPSLISLTLTRNSTKGAVTVDVTPGGTLASNLYTAPSQVNFADGVATTSVDVQLGTIPAATLATAKTITLAISNPVTTGNAANPATIGAQSSATITVNLVSTVSFSAATYSIGEPATGTVPLTVTVTRSSGAGAASVDVVAVDGTANAATDFSLPSPTVTLNFADTETSKSFVVTVNAATAGEAAETFQLKLQNGVNLAPTAPKTATVTIQSPDSAAPTLTLVNPKANAKVSGTSIAISGNATDDLGVARVEVRSGAGGPLIATLTNAGGSKSFDYSGMITPEQGVSTLEVKAFDLNGNASAAILRKITFTNVRPLLAGSYNGLIVADPAAAGLETNGLVSVTVTKTGSFTGSVSLKGGKTAITGTVLSGNALAFGSTKTATVDLKATVGGVKNTFLGKLALTLDSANKRIAGTVKDAAGTTTLGTVPHADLAVYNGTTVVLPTSIYDATKEKGKYTALFLADAAPNGGLTADKFPQGDGYGTITVSKAGVVKIIGKLADGAAVSYSNKLSQANTWPLFLSLYSGKGLVAGDVTFVETAGQSDANASNLKWFKAAAIPKQTVYPAGWPTGITVDFAASKYIAPGAANPDTVLGADFPKAANNTTANLTVTLDDGGLAASGTTDNASLFSAAGVKIIAGATPAPSLKLTFNASTGALTGSFKHPVTNATTSIFGAAFQKTHSAAGYFDSGAVAGGVTVVPKP